MRFLRKLSPNNLAGKKCLVRTNLDIANPHEHSMRIVKAIPTIRFLLDHSAHPIIISHRGRPKNADPALSLKPAITIIEKKLSSLYGSPTSIEWGENVRFDPREEKNDREYARELAARADIYINDDFAASHRASASLVAITEFLPSFAGLLLEEEIKNLSAIRDNPTHPLVIIIGGIKIKDTLNALDTLKNKADAVLFGSAHGYLNRSSCENDTLDIDEETINRYTDIITTAKTIIWNGPLGKIEDPPHDRGTQAIASAIIASKAFSVVGGGDTVEFLISRGLLQKFSFASTGGGAMLAYCAGEKLPALEALDKCTLV